MNSVPPLDLNHFICTLGEAKIRNLTPTYQYETINEFFDYQAENDGKQLAIAFPERDSEERLNYTSSSGSLGSESPECGRYHANFLSSHKPNHVETFDDAGSEKNSMGKSFRQDSEDGGCISLEYTRKNALGEKEVGVTEAQVDSSEWRIHFCTFRDLRDSSMKLAFYLDRTFRGLKDDSSQLRQILDIPVTMELPKCVGLLGRSDQGFLFVWLALMRLGVSVLIIMPSCTPEAVHHLCQQCNVRIVFYDYALLGYHAEASKLFEACNEPPFQMVGYSKESIMDLISHTSLPESRIFPFHKSSGKNIAYFHHTSGTSGLPKPVPYSHYAACGALPILNGRDTITFTTTPLFTGGIADCFRSWTSSSTICLAPDDGNPLTVEVIVDCFSQMRERYRLFRHELCNPNSISMYFSCVPMIAQMLSQVSKGLEFLRTMKIVGVGGATLPKRDGDILVSEGINLVSRFGSAECSFVLSTHRRYEEDKEWEYFRVPDGVPYLKFEPLFDDSGRFELVVTKGWPQLAKTNRDDGSWATSDLFEQHSSIKNAWKIVSRRDAQITLLTGKKFDPVVIEEAIKRHPLVQDVFVFGNGKVYPGAIIIKSEKAVDMDDEFLSDIIWPYIEKLNENGPTHAKIFKDMLVIKANTFSFEKTAKSTTKRQQSEEKYKADISNAYKSNLIVSDGEVSLEMVMKIVKKAIGNPIELQYDSDFRAHHIDSVQATRIRSHLNSVFSNNELFPWNIVYQCGSVRALTEYIKVFENGNTPDDGENEAEQMHTIVEQLGNMLKDNTTEACNMDSFVGNLKETIIITGVTGTLGVNIVGLLRSSYASKTRLRIVCFVRAMDDSEARKRVEEAVRHHDVDQTLASTTTVIEYRAVKLDQIDLGLSESVLEDLQKQATTIIHAAWEVNFSIPLKDFSKQFEGLCNLINLSLSGERPKHLVFCSSTASVANARVDTIESNTIIESINHNPFHANHLGYSKSKWVAEAICSLACQKTRANISILRIGQLTGNTINGTWNEKEAWPLMLSTGGTKSLNSLPRLDLPLSWLPVDVAAASVIDIALRNPSSLEPLPMPDEAVVFHLVNNSTTVKWRHLLEWIGHDKNAMEFDKWLAHAESPEGLKEDHPARSLLGFWKTMDRKMKEGSTVLPSFEVVRTRQVSPAMNSFTDIDEQLVKKIWKWSQTVA